MTADPKKNESEIPAEATAQEPSQEAVDTVSANASPETPADTAAETAISGSTASGGDDGIPANLALLLDAELEATIRFGDREMLLREIFDLMPGDVVELDQMIDEPAHLIVAGRTIAKGDVVVVDGNFGLRITEVASTSQRAEVIQA
jgi:flagellar motor switch protein FliN